MLIYGGSRDTVIEGGALYVIEKNGDKEIIANYSDDTMYRLSTTMQPSKYDNLQMLIAKGIDVDAAETIEKHFAEITGDNRSGQFRTWLIEQPYSAEQKRMIDGIVIGKEDSIPDYENPDAFYISMQSESVRKAAETAVNNGVSEEIFVTAHKKYTEEKTKGSGERDRFRDWLAKQRYTKKQKEQLDMLITGTKKPNRDY